MSPQARVDNVTNEYFGVKVTGGGSRAARHQNDDRRAGSLLHGLQFKIRQLRRQSLPEIYPSTAEMTKAFSEFDGPNAGDPRKAVRVIIEAVEAEKPPFRHSPYSIIQI